MQGSKIPMGINGGRLRALRELRKLTQEELADRIGVKVQQMWRYEKNQTEPNGEIISRLAKELETTSDYLLSLSDSPLSPIDEETLPQRERLLLDAFRRNDIRKIITIVDDLPRDKG